jgi:branched-chain amino acid transport system permease protein
VAFRRPLITFLGGLGTVWGPPLGAAFFLLISEILALRLVELHLLIFGILFIVIVRAFPGGFIEAWRNLFRTRRRLLRREAHAGGSSLTRSRKRRRVPCAGLGGRRTLPRR